MLLSFPAHWGPRSSRQFPHWLSVSPWGTGTMEVYSGISWMDLRVNHWLTSTRGQGPTGYKVLLAPRAPLCPESQSPSERGRGVVPSWGGTRASGNTWEASAAIRGEPSSKRKPGTRGESSLWPGPSRSRSEALGFSTSRGNVLWSHSALMPGTSSACLQDQTIPRNSCEPDQRGLHGRPSQTLAEWGGGTSGQRAGLCA